MGKSDKKYMKNTMKAKRKTKDIDEVQDDLADGTAGKLLNQPVDLDQIGEGQFYCVFCAYVLNLSK